MPGTEATLTQQDVAMRVIPTAAEIRRMVAQAFCDFGGQHIGPLDLDESMRIDGGKVVARTYRTDTHWAMWMIDIGLLQFYDDEGQMLRTVNLFEELEPVRAAA
jgi:hypothetical protein